MDGLHTALLTAGLLTVASVVSSRVSGALGVPALLVFLGVGMLAGSEGPGGIAFDDAAVAQGVASVALLYILFAGGLQTHVGEARPQLGRATLLATVGVVLTAGLLAAFAAFVLGWPLHVAALLGAIVASTDAAAVFGVFAGSTVRLRRGLQPLLELESGSNDPMAVFLTTGILTLLATEGAGPLDLVPAFLRQVALGGAVGLAGGVALARLINRVGLQAEGLYPVLTLGSVPVLFVVAERIGGNGFLAVYLAGLLLASRDLVHKLSIVRFHDGLAWLLQIVMFLTLGLLVFPSQLVPVALPGIVVALFLMFVARPAAVLLLLLGSPFSWRERLFVGWVGLRGAVPIVLATFPLLAGVPEAQALFNVVFFVVLTSSLLQGTTLVTAARWLGVTEPPPALAAVAPDTFGPVAGLLREIHLADDSAAVGKAIVDVGVPEHALILLIRRGRGWVVPRGTTRLAADDRLLVLGADDALHRLVERLHADVDVASPALADPESR